MKGISYITDIDGIKKALVLDLKLFENKRRLFSILEDLEDNWEIEARRNEPTFVWDDVKDQLRNL